MRCIRGHEFDKPLVLVCGHVRIYCPECKGEVDLNDYGITVKWGVTPFTYSTGGREPLGRKTIKQGLPGAYREDKEE